MTTARKTIVTPGTGPTPEFEGLVQYSSAEADVFNDIKVDTDGTIFASGISGTNAMVARLDSGLNVTHSLFVKGADNDNQMHDICCNSNVYAFGRLLQGLEVKNCTFRLSKADLSIITAVYSQRAGYQATTARGCVRSDGAINSFEGLGNSCMYSKWDANLTTIQSKWIPWAGTTQEHHGGITELSASESVVLGGFPTAIPRLCKFNTDTGALIVDSRSYFGSGRTVNRWRSIAKDATDIFVVGEADGTGGTLFAQVYKYTHAIVSVWDLAYTGTGENSFYGVLRNGDGLYCVGYTRDFTGTNKGALIVKINPDTPAFVAEKVFHNTYDCEFFGVDDDSDGNIYVSGYLGTASQPKAVVMKLNKDLNYTSISPGCASGLVVTNTSSSLGDSGAAINNQSIGLQAGVQTQATTSYTTQSPTMSQEGPCAFN